MGKIFKNMIPYWRQLILVLLLLFVQAWCDLSLPAYTSDIIDVGIQNHGIEHVLPAAVTAEEFETAKLLMTEKERTVWEESYEKDGDVYTCSVTEEERLDELDDTFLLPLLMNYQMSAIDEASFKRMLSEQTGTDASAFENVTIEEIGAGMGIELSTFEKETEDEDGNTAVATCVDMRQLLAAMQQAGMLGEEELLSMREEMESTVETMGSSLVKSMGIAYASDVDAAAGVDVDAIQTGYLWKAGLKMVGMALIMGIVTVCIGFLGSRIGAGIGRDLRGKIFARVVRFSNTEMDHFSTASLITRSTNDIQQIQMVCVVLIRMVAYAPILGIGGILKVLETGAGMSWIIVLAVLVILGYVMVLMSVAMPRFKLMQQLVDRINLVAREILTGLSVIRAFGREKREEERFDEANQRLTKTMLFTNRVMTFMMPGMMMIMNLLTVGIVWFGAHHIDEGTMQVGAMTAFITYSMMIVMAFLMLAAMSIMLPRANVAALRIDEVLKTEVSIQDPETPVHPSENVKGEIEFDHVSFAYPEAGENVLTDISFKAKKGQTIAVIGSTGSGKSTLINLIPRYYDVTKGSVKVDGVDVRDMTQKELRDKLGYVPQKGVLFSGTIDSNIRYGKPEITDTQVKEAAEVAQATEFIDTKPEKYESPVSQGGTNVSGGQKQRLSIARAIAKDPEIFIFDDSFSALDFKTDSQLRKALKEYTKDATTVIVAQRISTILGADQIIVLDDGHMAGIGTHKELMANCEVYQQIARSQLSEEELA